MRLSMRAEYGVRAMVVLALKFNRGLIPLKEIARKERISYQYLEQIFPLLKKAELVDSVRGRHGGYRLAREPADVSVGDIINAVEGPIADVYKRQDEGPGRRVPCWSPVRNSLLPG